MALKLIANYSKRLGLPGYSSHQFSVCVETEIIHTDDIAGESARLYQTLQQSVDEEIHRNEIHITSYGLLYRAATGKRESGLELHHLVKTKEPKLAITSTGPVTPDQEAKLYRAIESFVRGVEQQDYVPSPGLQCAACEFFAECCAWKGGK